jgi:hypothetical protein
VPARIPGAAQAKLGTLRRQYTLAYYPKKDRTAGGYNRGKVEVNKPNVKVRISARRLKGYGMLVHTRLFAERSVTSTVSTHFWFSPAKVQPPAKRHKC